MNLTGLCMNCMNGNITAEGVCSNCGKPQLREQPNRNANALPFGYILHNRYCIGRVLGAGGFGITYMARDLAKDRRVALKELYLINDLTRNPDGERVDIIKGQEESFALIKKSFLKEAELLSRFKNVREIVDVYHLFPDNNTAYYTMEFIDGEDLQHHLMRNGKMSWNELKPIAASALDQLEFLHKNNFIHRDISPDNIYLSKSGETRLIDFGSVRRYASGKSLTQFVKFNFSPIEQIRDSGSQGPWTDIFALSVTLYYCLTGKLPPKALDRALNDTFIPLDRLAQDVPPNVVAAIHKGMAHDYRNRFKTASEFKRALGLTVGPVPGPTVGTFNLFGISGLYRNARWRLSQNKKLVIGRMGNCDVRYPPQTPGVSHIHCTITLAKNGNPCIRDENSTFGTYVGGNRLQPGRWQYLVNGSTIHIGSQVFKVMYMQ